MYVLRFFFVLSILLFEDVLKHSPSLSLTPSPAWNLVSDVMEWKLTLWSKHKCFPISVCQDIGIYIWLQCTMLFTVFIILNFIQCKYGIVGSIDGKETWHELVEQVMSKNKYSYHVLA